MIDDVLREAEGMVQALSERPSRTELANILAKDFLTRLDYLKLLLTDDMDVLEQMARRAQALTERYFGKLMLLYAPLYLSDYCSNGCTYCGYSTASPHQRKTLNYDEIQAELAALKDAGFDSVLLLTGGSRRHAPVSYIAEASRIAANHFSEVVLEVYALTADEYRSVREAGASGLTLYQETYDRDLYRRVHPHGEKRDYDFRLQAPERAIAAGLKHVSIGPLLGLGPAVHDMFMAGVHGDYLQRKFPDVELSLSFPRMRRVASMMAPRDAVDDVRLVRFILATRLFLNRAGISISTRESAHMRDHLVGLGPTRMSAGSRTTVGGYAQTCERPGQFDIDDARGVADVVSMLQARGYRSEFTNWVKGLA